MATQFDNKCDNFRQIIRKRTKGMSRLEKLDGFLVDYSKEQTLIKSFVVFDFEAICVPSEEL